MIETWQNGQRMFERSFSENFRSNQLVYLNVPANNDFSLRVEREIEEQLSSMKFVEIS